MSYSELHLRFRESWCAICATIETAEYILGIHPKTAHSRVDRTLPGSTDVHPFDNDLIFERSYTAGGGVTHTISVRVMKLKAEAKITAIIDTPNYDAEEVDLTDSDSESTIRRIIVGELVWIDKNLNS
jgi:hypothetical protein